MCSPVAAIERIGTAGRIKCGDAIENVDRHKSPQQYVKAADDQSKFNRTLLMQAREFQNRIAASTTLVKYSVTVIMIGTAGAVATSEIPRMREQPEYNIRTL